MEQAFKKSEPTGLITGGEIALVAGNASTMYTVLTPGVVGRTSWEGRRIWDTVKESGSWHETVGQEGPRKGAVRLKKGTKEFDAKFLIEWVSDFYVHYTYRKVNPKKTPMRSATLTWTMNFKRTITIEGVDYERVVRKFEETVTLPFKPV